MGFDFGQAVSELGAGVAKTVEELGKAATDTVSTVADAAAKAIAEAEERAEAGKRKREAEYLDGIRSVRSALSGTNAERYLGFLGESPVTLTQDEVSKAVGSFPIPREQHVLWMDAEFDFRPSGIVVTEKGVFIKTDVNPIALPSGKDDEKKSVLYYFRWEDFNPSWFKDGADNNLALSVNAACSAAFIERCGRAAAEDILEHCEMTGPDTVLTRAAKGMQLGAIAAVAGESAQNAVFVEQKAAVNLDAGHGEMAEEANTLLDKIHGLDARVTGRNNTRNGDDRRIRELGVDKIFIQTKYCKKWRSSLEASFESGGNYRYYDEAGNPMQLEVPKDQYRQVVDGFKIKIKQGKVPGVTDPEQAGEIVREGRLTYDQAKNLTKPGNIESLTYDALTGVISCSCAFGITFVATTFLAWRKTGNLQDAIQAGMIAGIQVFGLSFVQHMIVSQVARTSLAKSLVAPSEFIVGKLGKDATQTIANGLRTLAGKSPIYGAAATKHLAKIMRNNTLTAAITLVVFSIPDTYNLVQRKISGSQYAKNLSVLAAGTAAGVAGGVAAGVAAAKIAGAAGTVVTPGVGTVIGVVGGFVGGTVGSMVAGAVGDVLHEGDAAITGRLFNAILSCMIGEYLFDEKEVETLIARLGKVKDKELSQLFDTVFQAEQQEDAIRQFLCPLFDEVATKRPKFILPSNAEIDHALEEAAIEGDSLGPDEY